ncbi:MAG: hypothetical protein JWO45_1433 [Spartobacteria bacterium]|nr:hypothetical protein [Spartobacteria bacterium]
MSPTALMKNQQESTYALLVRSEEKSRGVLECVAYSAFILSAIFAILQFVNHPVKIPAAGIEPCVACTLETRAIISEG